MKRCIWIASMLCIMLTANSCGKKKEGDARFATPSKTYEVWTKTAVRGDFAANIECVTKASVSFMDSQAKQREEFMERMVQAAKIFNNYVIDSENIKGDKAVVVIKEPKTGGSVAIPFQYEEGSWKVDLIAMFSGFVQGSN